MFGTLRYGRIFCMNNGPRACSQVTMCSLYFAHFQNILVRTWGLNSTREAEIQI
ncbi:unnamed protein product [Linum tenue]|uniref:Uncharacterized protein n=1 Tax=Linum tenue TaxID=586396 RepID=A0AAV0JNF3_9ROSI|nr:unnamed protein product [Linum tenue]